MTSLEHTHQAKSVPPQHAEIHAPPMDNEDEDRTYTRQDLGLFLQPGGGPTGNIDLAEQIPIYFEIQGKTVALPVAELIIVGRTAPNSPCRPEVDLSAFEGERKTISRQHIRLKRKGTLVYVADLGSANGSWLNGKRLRGERLLRDGDALTLGTVQVRIRFGH